MTLMYAYGSRKQPYNLVNSLKSSFAGRALRGPVVWLILVTCDTSHWGCLCTTWLVSAIIYSCAAALCVLTHWLRHAITTHCLRRFTEMFHVKH